MNTIIETAIELLKEIELSSDDKANVSRVLIAEQLLESTRSFKPRAFPTSEEYESEGMTLRDYFAAKAMLGLLSTEKHVETSAEKLAGWAYQQADAMLKTRAL